mmetsp:Transcript_36869/g.77337  ORF Transcript_36869/g.77337 Transcript_36869/m.77337 type:complete len:292 (+) Transcript_36869:73-948(+)
MIMIMMILNHQPRLLTITSGGTINTIPTPLRRNDPSSPWCYAASLTPPIPLDDDDDGDVDGDGNSPTASSPSSSPTPMLPPGSNFLATQVWPSSRIASTVIEKHMDPTWTVCELGCGPGLPSLTAAKSGARRVIATDVDKLALEMVCAAAADQGFIKNHNNDDDDVAEDWEEQPFVTKQFDLTCRDNSLPKADLYVLSDVFESAAVAEGAAWHVQSILSANQKIKNRDSSRVWVFAQSDRAQRDCFLEKIREWYGDEDDEQLNVGWSMDHAPDRDEELWLFDLDETMVKYN